jgi:hypothetical protein
MRIKLFLILLLTSCKLFSQNQPYYGWFYEGDGVAKGLKLFVDTKKNVVDDSISVLYSIIHNVGEPIPEDNAGWKNAFKNNQPMKIKLDSINLKDKNIFFKTERCIIDTSEWFQFIFNGKRDKNKLKGTIIQLSSSKYSKEKVFSEKYKIIFEY